MASVRAIRNDIRKAVPRVQQSHARAVLLSKAAIGSQACPDALGHRCAAAPAPDIQPSSGDTYLLFLLHPGNAKTSYNTCSTLLSPTVINLVPQQSFQTIARPQLTLSNRSVVVLHGASVVPQITRGVCPMSRTQVFAPTAKISIQQNAHNHIAHHRHRHGIALPSNN